MTKVLFPNITCLILTGGKSRRMGTDKALIEINGETVLRRIYKIASGLFPRIILCGNGAGKYNITGAETAEDIRPEGGPLSGIHAGLSKSGTEINFVLSCDLPLITEEAISAIAGRYNNQSILAAASGGDIHYLCGIYNRRILPVMDELFLGYTPSEKKNPNLSLKTLADRTGYAIFNFDSPELARLRKTLFNLNLPEDLKKLHDIKD